MEKQTVQISVTANLNHSSMIRHIADEIFMTAKFSKAWASRLKLVADELFMNAVRYGSTENKSTIYITFEYDSEGIKFTMEDDGTGSNAIDPEELQSKIQANEQNTDLAKTSGRGLSMITKLWTDEMEVKKSEHGGIAVSFTKRLETAADPPPSPPPPPELAQQLQQEQQQVSATATGTVAPVISNQPSATVPTPVATPAISNQPSATSEIKLSGEIDQSNIAEKTAQVNDQIAVIPEGGTLVLDFSDLTYVNSTFIGSLAGWHTTMQHKGGHIRLRNINDQVKEILELVGLMNILEIEN